MPLRYPPYKNGRTKALPYGVLCYGRTKVPYDRYTPDIHITVAVQTANPVLTGRGQDAIIKAKIHRERNS